MRLFSKMVLGVGLGVILGFGSNYLKVGMFDLSPFTNWIQEIASSQMAQAGFFFTLASWMHATRVKKEIKDSFSILTTSIDNVSKTLREDLQKHGERIDRLDHRVETLEKKI